MRELQLIEVDGDGTHEGRIVQADDGTVTTEGAAAVVFESIKRRTGFGDAEAFGYAFDAGWSNGPLALRRIT